MTAEAAISLIMGLVSPRLGEVTDIIEAGATVGEGGCLVVDDQTGDAIIAQIRTIVAQEAIIRGRAPSVAQCLAAVRILSASKPHQMTMLKEIVDGAATEALAHIRELAEVAPAGEA